MIEQFKCFFKFAVELCCVMIMNKVLKKLGIDLREECFSHMWPVQKLVLQRFTCTGSITKNSRCNYKEDNAGFSS